MLFMMKKPIVNGFQYGVDQEPEWLFDEDLLSNFYIKTESTFKKKVETDIFLEINTDGFYQQAKHGDYVIKVCNKLFVIPQEIFDHLFYGI